MKVGGWFSVVFLCLMLAALLLGGCKENPVEEYGNTLIESHEKAKQTQSTVDIGLLRRSIDMYKAQNGRYPENVEELSQFSGVEVDPSQVDYNPQKGTIALK